MTKLFNHLVLIGGGLIGSSIARAVRKYDLVERLSGFDNDAGVRQRLNTLNLFDHVFETPQAMQHNQDHPIDCMILCTPLSAMVGLVETLAPMLPAGAIISDTGSCKLHILDEILPKLPKDVIFIPAHPIAGTEHSGPDAGFAELFEQRYCILTPPTDTPKPAIEKLTKLWQGMGSIVEHMEPYHHDRVLAITSHLPHAIAYTIVRTAADLETQLAKEKINPDDLVYQNEVMRYAAGGFRDFTRIANSNPIMWRDIFMQNKEPVIEMIGRFTEDLFRLQRAIRDEDSIALEQWFTETKAIRHGVEALNQAGQFIATEDQAQNSD